MKTKKKEKLNTDVEIWYYIKKKQFLELGKCDVSSRLYYLKFTFKGPEYVRNIVSFG